jgi:tRNA (cmo5U34)-methyltransferase
VTEGWIPDVYIDDIRAEIPRYDELQENVVAATQDLRVLHALELGVGTGESAHRLLDAHPSAVLIGIDGSEEMLTTARTALPADRVELRLQRLEGPLPSGRFDLVVSVLAIHHLPGEEKANLFVRVAAALAPGGRFVFGDVVVPERAEDAIVPIEQGFDLPDRLDDQISWLAAAGLAPRAVWSWKDLAVVRADAQSSV